MMIDIRWQFEYIFDKIRAIRLKKIHTAKHTGKCTHEAKIKESTSQPITLALRGKIPAMI